MSALFPRNWSKFQDKIFTFFPINIQEFGAHRWLLKNIQLFYFDKTCFTEHASFWHVFITKTLYLNYCKAKRFVIFYLSLKYLWNITGRNFESNWRVFDWFIAIYKWSTRKGTAKNRNVIERHGALHYVKIMCVDSKMPKKRLKCSRCCREFPTHTEDKRFQMAVTSYKWKD